MGSAGTAEQQRHHVIRLSELSCGLGFTVQQFLHSAFTDLKNICTNMTFGYRCSQPALSIDTLF